MQSTLLSFIPLPVLGLSLLLSVGCGDNQDPEAADDFWQRIQEADYQSWERAPGYESPAESNAAHGSEVVIYINDVIEDALTDPSLDEWPVGSIIVKDGFKGGDLSLIAGMEKVAEGDDGWFWVEYNGSGDTLFSGAPTICTGCHRVGDDWVRGFFLAVER